jgi:protein arginine N-methyltransferase 2
MNHVEVYQLISTHGFRAEVLRLTMEAPDQEEAGPTTEPGSTATNNGRFLASKLTFKTSPSGQQLCIDSEGNGVMQGWETEIMRQTARRLCEPFLVRNKSSDFELSILNVGFGLGIIDSFFQLYQPTRHLIIEPHPDVLQFINHQDWPNKHGVQIYPGRWQDFLVDVQQGKILANFDVIYWDTFSEDYRSLKTFFDNVFDLLSGSEARFSWFHGPSVIYPSLPPISFFPQVQKRIQLTPLSPEFLQTNKQKKKMQVSGRLRVRCMIFTRRWPRWI